VIQQPVLVTMVPPYTAWCPSCFAATLHTGGVCLPCGMGSPMPRVPAPPVIPAEAGDGDVGRERDAGPAVRAGVVLDGAMRVRPARTLGTPLAFIAQLSASSCENDIAWKGTKGRPSRACRPAAKATRIYFLRGRLGERHS
jgi:hypothetical protein